MDEQTKPSSPADLDAVKEDLAMLRADVGELTESLLKSGKDKANQTYQSSVDSVQDYVQSKPMTALGMAFGAGIMAAIMLGRR